MGKTKVRYSLPQEFFQKQSPNQLKGKLLYSITIPQLGIVANGLLDKTSPVDWILLDYIRRWELNKRAQAITRDGKRLVRINFKHLLECLPILQYFDIHSKPPITRRLKKLSQLELIKTFKAKDNTLFVRLTDKTWECYQTRLDDEEDEISPPVPPREKQPVSHIEKYPVPPREEQHNRESIENHNKESFKKKNYIFNSFLKDNSLLEEKPVREKEDHSNPPSNSSHKEKLDHIVGSLVDPKPDGKSREKQTPKFGSSIVFREGKHRTSPDEISQAPKITPEGYELLCRIREHLLTGSTKEFNADAVMQQIKREHPGRTNG